MTRHAGPGGPAAAPPPEPSLAERARTLVHLGRAGTLATVSRRHAGHPFASVMPYAGDRGGRPLLLISRMAVHTQNLEADPRASLLVAAPAPEGDPLAVGRVTLMGRAGRLPGAAEEAGRERYLARHPRARSWAGFEDFGVWRLTVEDLYVVGGFGVMGWVEGREYLAASPDPLADAAEGIIEHMNRDHAPALVILARVPGGQEPDAARMLAVDRLGFKLRLVRGERRWSARIPFPREVRTAEECRAALIEMLEGSR